MTALIFIAGIVAVYVAVPNGFYQMGPLTVYQWAFLATTLSASVWAAYSRDRMAILSAGILLGATVLSWRSWHTYDPELSTALLDLGIAAWFILLGRRPWEYICGTFFLLSVFTGVLTETGFITAGSHRPPMVIAWSHPDITAILGHLSAITLGAASGDSGKRVRSYLMGWTVGHSLAHRGYSGLLALGKAHRPGSSREGR